MTDDVAVSIVVSTRNRASLLPHSLRSLTVQSSAVPFEIVVVDNGSSDSTGDMVRDWSRRDERVRLVEEPKVGLSSAKNAGLRSVRGSLVLFTDDDVVVPDGWVATYAAFFAARPGFSGVAGGPVLPIAHDLSRWPPWLSPAATVDLPRLYHGPQERSLEGAEWIWGANMACRATYLSEAGSFDESLGRTGDERGTFEDVELVDRVRTAGGQVWYCPTAVVHHRVDAAATRPRALVSKAFNRGANDFLRAQRGSYFEPDARVPGRSLPAAMMLPCLFASWILCAGGFRLVQSRSILDLVRRSAWGAGWCLAASTERRSRRIRFGVRRVIAVVRALTLRLTPE